MEGYSVNRLFSSGLQYEIPIYQRRYVWEESNWQQLWADIKDKTNLRAGGIPRSHFTGIIITSQKENGVGVPKFEIIDGQQRLTTFQIILCVIRDICTSASCDNPELQRIAESADRHIKNENHTINIEDRNTHDKFLPTVYDRKAFQALVDNVDSDSNHLIFQAYRYFKAKFEDYASSYSKEQIEDSVDQEYDNIQNLFASITQDFSLVQIDLDPDDEPEKIFASLNATGRMLYEFDYLRNNLFLRAGKDGEKERQRLYDDHWVHFENHEHYWNSQTLETFFHNFLEAKLDPSCFQQERGHQVKAFDLYQTRYRKVLTESGKTLDEEFAELKRYSEIYQEINANVQMQFYELFDIDGWDSLILSLIANGRIGVDYLELILRVLESYTVRRMVCYGPKHKSPNKSDFLPWISRRLGELENFSVEGLVEILSQARKPYQWPNDNLVEDSLRRYANNIDKDFLCYILYRIEFHESENLPREFESFTRKHVMPLRWEGIWPLPVGKNHILYNDLFRKDYKIKNRGWGYRPSEEGLVDRSEDHKSAFRLALDRKYAVQSVGNLTIVEHPLARSRMPSDFLGAKDYLSKSKLGLNNKICEYETWEVEQIRERTDDLIRRFCEIWPSANKLVEDITGVQLNSRSDNMIQLEPYKFMTYDGLLELSDVKPRQYDLVGTGDGGNKNVLSKDDILFAFPVTAMTVLESYLSDNMDSKVASKSLTSVSRYLAPQVPDETLSGARKQNTYMKLVTRSGHMLHGMIEDFDLYCIYMQIKGQTVVVYRHGLLQHERLSEKEFSLVKLDEMIQSKTYVFITIADDVEMSQVNSQPNEVIGIDKDGKKKILKKRDIVFAYSADARHVMKNKIDLDESVLVNQETQKRKSVGKDKKQRLIKDWILRSAQEAQFKIRVATYSGNILQGIVEDFDEIAIYLRVDEYTLILFKHGVHTLSTPEWYESTVKEFYDKQKYGFIEFSKNRRTHPKGIYVNSRRVVDRSLLPLKVGQRVKFNVEHTAEKGLRAINVKDVAFKSVSKKATF